VVYYYNKEESPSSQGIIFEFFDGLHSRRSIHSRKEDEMMELEGIAAPQRNYDV
jgi:hypothetical protein